MRKHLWVVAVGISAALLAGCGQDDSMSNTIKPNPEMANRYKQPPGGLGQTPPPGIAGGGAPAQNQGSGGGSAKPPAGGTGEQ